MPIHGKSSRRAVVLFVDKTPVSDVISPSWQQNASANELNIYWMRPRMRSPTTIGMWSGITPNRC